MCTSATAARADDLRVLGNIGDAHKASGLISGYHIDEDSRTLNVTAAVPSVAVVSRSVERQLANQTARQMCGEGTADRVSGWTVRIFMPGESTPAGTCHIGRH
ncbi:MAG TPA: hypothetical protein VKV77_04810 [Methylovirgula sp.]|nr:hypothetical protein [Methylovirgula sp.]